MFSYLRTRIHHEVENAVRSSVHALREDIISELRPMMDQFRERSRSRERPPLIRTRSRQGSGSGPSSHAALRDDNPGQMPRICDMHQWQYFTHHDRTFSYMLMFTVQSFSRESESVYPSFFTLPELAGTNIYG